MTLELPETFNWCTAAPTIGLGEEHLSVLCEGLLHWGWADGLWSLDMEPQLCSWGALSWAMGLGPGLFLQVLHNPPILMAFLLSSPAKEQYFIPGRRVGESRPA